MAAFHDRRDNTIKGHMQDHHGMGLTDHEWTNADINRFHDNLHTYGGSIYDRRPNDAGRLTHDHKGLPTRKSRKMPNG